MWGAILGGMAGDLIGGYLEKEGTRQASNAQERMSEAAIAEQRRQYDQTRTDLEPWRQAGTNALEQLIAGLNQQPQAADVMQDPGYQFGLEQGQRALDRQFAASGGRVSGSALKAAQRYGQGYASTKYGEAYQRRQDALNRLQAIAGLGQTSTTASAAAGANSANAISGILQNRGDALGGAALNTGRIWGNTARNFAAGWPAQSQGNGIYSMMRANDPYRYAGYYGGEEGE